MKAVREMVYELAYNLVENAVKYNRTNGKVDVAVFSRENAIGFKISDTGIGISPKEQKRIFERFYRSDTGRGKAPAGNGLGLSIAKHIAILYNGSISVSSGAGGSVFEVRFPKSRCANGIDGFSGNKSE